MRILGIETSCDETAVCLLECEDDFGRDFKFEILGNALFSQAKMHAEYGGVFPNLAKREHAKNLVPMLEQALREAGQLSSTPRPGLAVARPGLGAILAREPELFERLEVFLKKYAQPEIDAIAVTYGPGLEPALWVGINFAKALSLTWNTPIVAVNHMEGHIVMSMMKIEGLEHSHILQNMRVSGTLNKVEFPSLALLISGGHTELVLSKKWMDYELIGQTRDDAVGEAFDKVARMLGLGYPGGPQISRMAELARTEDLQADFKLPRPMMREDNFDFSFAGLKTAVLKIVGAKENLDDDFRKKIAREFEDAAADVLVSKTLRAVEEFGVNTLVVGGGVSANTYIRLRLAEALAEVGGTSLLVSPPELATDNAIMIALCGYFHAQKSNFADPALLTATGNLRLS